MRHLVLMFGLTVVAPCYGQVLPRVAVFDLQPIGVDEPTTKAASELLRNELTNLGKFKVIRGEGFCSTVEEAVERAKGLEADKAVMGSLTKLGEKVIVFASLIDADIKEVEFSDQIVSVRVEDLDTVLKRLALGLVEKKKLEETAEWGRIVEKEVEAPRRRETFLTYGAKAGYMFPILGGYGGHSEKMFTADLLTWYETPSFLVEPLAGISISGESHDIHGDISIYRPLSKTDFSPYLGGGIGLHSVGCERDTTYYYDGQSYTETHYKWNHGFGLSLGGGVIGFRTYDFRLILDIKYSVVWAKLLEEDGQDGISLTIGTTYGSTRGMGEMAGLLGMAGAALAGIACIGCVGCLAF